jgi:hypothetical protein
VRAGAAAVRDAAEQAGKARGDVRCVVRGVAVVRDGLSDADRAPLQGTAAQIRDGLARYADCGVDEVFLDLNFDSDEVGNPTADASVAMAKARALLDACAPV